jgi:hypothetical protein
MLLLNARTSWKIRWLKRILHLRKRGAMITVQGQIENEKTPKIGVFLS